MERLISNQRGGATIEWLGALVLVVALALLIGGLGKDARHRIAGEHSSGDSFRATSTFNAPGDVNSRLPTDSTIFLASHANVSPTLTPTNPPISDDSDMDAGCRNGFANGAMRAFVNGEGELVGDMFGVRDRDIVDWIWNRPTSEVVGDVQRGAPGIVAAVPGVFTNLGNAAITSVRNDPLGATGAVIDAVFIDSLRTTAQLAVDGWHGGGVLIAAAQSGDCVAFGRTLRSGVSNAPELALNAGDAVGLLGAGAALGATAARSHRVAALAKLANAKVLGKLAGEKTIAKIGGREALSTAVHSVDGAATIARHAAHTPNVTAARQVPAGEVPSNVTTFGSAVSTAAQAAAATGRVLTGWSGRDAFDGAVRFVTHTGAAASQIAQSVSPPDLANAGRYAVSAGKATIAALGTATVATRVGFASLGQAAHGVRSQFTTFTRTSLFERRARTAVQHHATAPAEVPVRKHPERATDWPELFLEPEDAVGRYGRHYLLLEQQDGLRMLMNDNEGRAFLDRYARVVLDEAPDSDVMQRLDKELLELQGDRLASLESDGSFPVRVELTPSDLRLWANAIVPQSPTPHAFIDERTMEFLLTSPWAAPLEKSVERIIEHRRDLARIAHRQRTSDSVPGWLLDFQSPLVARNIVMQMDDVTVPLRALAESDIIARQLSTQNIHPSAVAHELASNEDVVRFHRPMDARIAETSATEQTLRLEIARLATLHERVRGGEHLSFLARMRRDGLSLVVDAPADADIDQRWLLSIHADGDVHLKPFPSSIRPDAPLASRNDIAEPVILKNLRFDDEDSIRAFLLFMIP